MLQQDANDPRLTEARQWLATLAAPAVRVDTLRPASADASFRRYFRVDADDGATCIVMDAPPPQEDVRPFVRIAELFGKTGVSVPRVLAQDVERGFLLLTDLGATTYLHQLNIDTARGRTRAARRAGSAPAAAPASRWRRDRACARYRC